MSLMIHIDSKKANTIYRNRSKLQQNMVNAVTKIKYRCLALAILRINTEVNILRVCNT